MSKHSEKQIANALAEHCNYLGQNIIVLNVSWGFFSDHREVDLLILKPSGYCEEIEIKLTSQDLIREKKKRSRYYMGEISDVPDEIKAKWFCVPEELKDHPDIPDYCGIYYVTENEYGRPKIIKHRTPKLNPRRRILTEKERLKLLRLAHIKLWSERIRHDRREKQDG